MVHERCKDVKVASKQENKRKESCNINTYGDRHANDTTTGVHG